MATLTTVAPIGLNILAAPVRAVVDAVEMLRAAQRAAHMADALYNKSDAALALRGLRREDVSATILSELERR